MIYISGVLPELLPHVWDDCEPYISMGNSRGKEEQNTHDIYHKIKNQEMQLWILSNDDKEIVSVLTTEIIQYPRRTTCRIVTLGGKDLDEWVEDWLNTLETWALENGCEAIETCCRKGFAKKLEKFGYENTYTVLAKELLVKH